MYIGMFETDSFYVLILKRSKFTVYYWTGKINNKLLLVINVFLFLVFINKSLQKEKHSFQISNRGCLVIFSVKDTVKSNI